jgi:SPP1 family predicted phage head-tail adaptor
MGDDIKSKIYKSVFANKKPIKSNEFYQAAATRIKPSLMFEISTIDYDEQELLRYDSKEYTIIRTYAQDEKIELVCESLVI